MDVLTSAETFVSLVVERLVVPRRCFQPCELASLLRKSILHNRHRLPFDTFVPNRFLISLPPDDYRRMKPLLGEIIDDLSAYIIDYVEKMNFKTVEAISIEMKCQDKDKRLPVIEVSFSSSSGGEKYGDKSLE